MIIQPARDLNGSIERVIMIKELVSRTINMQILLKILDNIHVIDMEHHALVKTGMENYQQMYGVIIVLVHWDILLNVLQLMNL